MKAPRTRTKYLPIYLPGDVYTRLEHQALAQERDPLQHVRWLIRQGVDQSAQAEALDRLPIEAGTAH